MKRTDSLLWLIITILFIPIIGIFFYQPPPQSEAITQAQNTNQPFCRPEVDPNTGWPYADPQKSNPISISSSELNPFSIDPTWAGDYRLIKSDIPIFKKATVFSYLLNNGVRHFDPTTIVISKGSDKYAVFIPRPETSEPFLKPDGTRNSGTGFKELGLIFLIKIRPSVSTPNINNSDDFETIQITNRSGNPIQLHSETYPMPMEAVLVDIYQKVISQNSNQPLKNLPSDILNCVFSPTNQMDSNQPDDDYSFHLANNPNSQVAIPNQPVSSDRKQLQLEYFNFTGKSQELNGYAWYWPYCKPAIYLYPTQITNVNVKVNTEGFLTYTDPPYNPETGWNVTTYPNGQLISHLPSLISNTYPYLYYESKVPDHLISIPKNGYIVKKDQLPRLFDQLLPKLGLNSKESAEFKDYWTKALHDSPYYFVGVMDQDNINSIEPLTVNPPPKTVIRVRTFFQALSESEAQTLLPQLSPPTLTTPTRSGFTLVEWGGMVKNDKDHPFTCSQ